MPPGQPGPRCDLVCARERTHMAASRTPLCSCGSLSRGQRPVQYFGQICLQGPAFWYYVQASAYQDKESAGVSSQHFHMSSSWEDTNGPQMRLARTSDGMGLTPR